MSASMIVSASYRTDIPAFYADWFRRRLAAGAVQVANPYGSRPYRVPLAGPEVDGLIFWSRNLAPFRSALDDLAARGLPFVAHLTVLGYPRALDRSVIEVDDATAQIRAIARRFGSRAAVWRYDPILLTSLTPAEWHRATFARLAAALAGHVDEAVVSFATIYRKTARNLAAAAERHGFAWHDPPAGEKRALLADLAGLAADHGMALSVCTQPDLLVPGARPAACVDAGRLSDVAGRPIAARRKGNRPGCECAESRDIGAYDTCPHGCAYCYAVGDRDRAMEAFRRHDPARDRLARDRSNASRRAAPAADAGRWRG